MKDDTTSQTTPDAQGRQVRAEAYVRNVVENCFGQTIAEAEVQRIGTEVRRAMERLTGVQP